MTANEAGVDFFSAPKTYEDLYRQYYEYVVALVRQAGIEEDSKEDVACSILLRFFERDFLNEFDPNLVFLYQGEERRARFKSFLSKFVLVYVQSYREKQTRRHRRELHCTGRSMVAPKHTTVLRADPRSPVEAEYWFDILAADAGESMEDSIISGIAGNSLVDELRAHLATIPRHRANDLCDLVALFDAIVVQVDEHGCCDISRLREAFGVSPTSIHSWMWRLRACIAQYLNRPLPPKRPRTLAPAA